MFALASVDAAVGVAAGLLVAAVVVAAVAFYLVRVVVVPLRKTALIADQLAGGRLDPRLVHTGLGEISRLGRSVNILGSSVGRGLGGLAQLVEAQTAMRRVAMLVARGVGPSEVFDAVTGELGRLIGADGANIVRFDGDESGVIVALWGWPGSLLPVGTRISLRGTSVSAAVLRTGRAARMDSYEDTNGPLATFLREQGIRSAVGAPIYVEGRLWGAATASMLRNEPLPSDAEARLADCTDLVATAIANAEARSELIDSRARLVLATDQTRRRIERDLHDGVQQRLLWLGLELRAAQEAVPDTLTEAHTRLSSVVDGLTAGIDELREISRGIHPTILTDRGLAAAVKALARRSRVAVEVDVRLRERPPEPVEAAAYYVIAESLANAAKHAEASLVRVAVTANDERLHVTLSDDGVGGADPARGTGLLGIRDRVHALGGTMHLDSPPGEGTTLDVALPLP
ncbi:GAF domain-containing sensor histidine kinase [Dactylosporangium sp. NPDC051485]|uniref:GAF domain-containing sensor histidine kinase n=1 Tax=Dactylosporangium sp. NPDC051485 TaxID=3154846 RepID=UPI003421A54A